MKILKLSILTIILLICISKINCQGYFTNLTLYTYLSGNENNTVFSDGIVNNFWMYDNNPCPECGRPNAAIEPSGADDRTFYLINDDIQPISISSLTFYSSNYDISSPAVYGIDQSLFNIRPGEIIPIHVYYECQYATISNHNLNGWVMINFAMQLDNNNSISFNYLKICNMNDVTFDWSLTILFTIAILTVALGTIYQKSYLAEQEQKLKPCHAIIFVIACYAVSIFCYFYSEFAIPIITGLTTLFGFVCTTYIMNEMLSKIAPQNALKYFRIPLAGIFNTVNILSFFIGLSIIIPWFITRQYILNNIIALCITFFIIRTISLPSLKVAAIFLIAAFIYDIFWTLITVNLTGFTIMAHLARYVDLPLKIEWPIFPVTPYPICSLLSIGDMVLPGFFVAFTYKFDLQQRTRIYYTLSLVGYIIGFSMRLFFLIEFQAAQPTLLYLVPWQLGLVMIFALWRKEFRKIWKGSLNEMAWKDSLLGEQKVMYEQSLEIY